MTAEKENITAGRLYDVKDEVLVKERCEAKELLFLYNRLAPSESGERNKLMRKLLGSAKGNFHIEPPFHCDYGYNIHLGENFYANTGCVMLDGAEIVIGDNVLLAPNVGLYTAGHPISVSQRVKGFEYAYPVTIGNNVWIGGGTVILPGVTIGDNSVIGAGSVVAKDILANVVAVGNPCRVLRNLTEEER